MSPTAAGPLCLDKHCASMVDAVRTQTQRLDDEVHRLQLSVGEADCHQRWHVAVERALRDALLVGGDAGANLEHAKRAIWQSTLALDVETLAPAEALRMAADESTWCRLEVARGDGQAAWSASVPLRGRPAAWLLLLDLLLHRELRPGPGPAAVAAASAGEAAEAAESPSAMAARTRVGSRVGPGRDWDAAAAAGVQGTVTAVDHGAGVVDVLWDGWVEPRTHCLGRRDKYHVRLLDAAPASVSGIEQEIEEAKARLLIQRRCIDALESHLNEVEGRPRYSKDEEMLLNEFMLKNLDAIVQSPIADAVPSPTAVQLVSPATASQDSDAGLEASVPDESALRNYLEAQDQGLPAEAVPSTIEGEVVSPARSQDGDGGGPSRTRKPDESALKNLDAQVQGPPAGTVPSTNEGEVTSPARSQDGDDGGPSRTRKPAESAPKNLDAQVLGPPAEAVASPGNQVVPHATSLDDDDGYTATRESDVEAEQAVPTAPPLDGEPDPSLAPPVPSSESCDGNGEAVDEKKKKKKNRRRRKPRRFRKREGSQTNDDQPPSPSSKDGEANLPRLKLVVDKLAEDPHQDTPAKLQAVEDAKQMGVRVLSSLWCSTDMDWHLSLLRAAWPTLEKLHCRIVTFECLQLVNSMPRLRRLYVASDPDMYQDPRPLSPLPFGRAGALEWLRAYMPAVTLRSLLAAHASTLREVVVCVGTLSDAVTRALGPSFTPRYPYMCGDLHPLFEGRRFPRLRRVVVWRSASFQHEVLHCRAQLAGVRRVLPKTVAVVCTRCNPGVREDEFYE